MQRGQPQSSGPAAVRFPEECAIVLDRWLYDVCEEEGMQFPSHRRAQFPAFMEHCRFVSKQKTFVAGTFVYPSRSGAREVLVLQTLLEALGAREQECLRVMNKVQASIEHFRKVLSDKTMGASDLTSSQVKPTRAPHGGGGDDNEAAAAVPPRGYTPLPNSNGSGGTAAAAAADAFSDDAREARRAQYEQKRSIAQRYTAELTRHTAEVSEKRVAMEARYKRLLGEKSQLDKEYAALKATEEMVVGRQAETTAKLAEEQAALEQERAAWVALSGDAPPPATPAGVSAASADDTADDESRTAGSLKESMMHLNKTLATGAAADVTPEEQSRQETLERLRARLSEAGTAAQEMRRQLLNGEQVHSGRFRQARQRLKDWQDLVANVRRTQRQLTGQVNVLGTVVRDTAERLAAHTAAADRAGYLEQVYRFNALLAARSSEKLREFMGEEAVSSPTSRQLTGLHGVNAFTTEVKPLARPAPGAGGADGGSAASTPLRHGTAAVMASADNDPSPPPPPKHRSRYDLVRHLQRWEVALHGERAQLLQAAGMVVSDRTTGENAVKPSPDGPRDARVAHQRQKFLQLQKMLLQAKP